MEINRSADCTNFFVAGISYKKADVTTRGLFSINSDQYCQILNGAPAFKIDALFVLSTCNRTEIYGFADNPFQLAQLLCTETLGSYLVFANIAYVKHGENAVEHLFNVGAGLDSQILGDYEIIGQLKQAVKFSKERGFINCFLERLANNVLQTSKRIKNETGLSGGTVSASYAAVQYIKEHVAAIENKKILLVGTGKIGRNTCKNMVNYLGTTNIKLINRSEEKARALASELNLTYAPLYQLGECIAEANIIITATSADEPAILRADLQNKGPKLIIDLSLPNNVEAAVKLLTGITLINIDELSRLKDETLHKRKAEAPKAQTIIAGQVSDFLAWCQMRKNAPALNAIKSKLNEISAEQQTGEKSGGVCPLAKIEAKIQKVINGIAYKMRSHNQQGCHYIEAINEFMKAG